MIDQKQVTSIALTQELYYFKTFKETTEKDINVAVPIQI